MMRRPTDRAVAWQAWRNRVEGRAPRAVLTQNDIQCGLYKARRHGQWVGVQIDLVADVDDLTGELLSEERFAAFVGADAFYDAKYVDEIWLRCCGNPVTEEEFERLQRMPAVRDLTREVIV